jgi:diacylglycerol kinase
MSEKLHLNRHGISFSHAFAGIRHTFTSQPNLRIHTAVAVLVVIMAFWLRVTRLEWLILLFTLMWVITAEMVNTSVESIVNLITHEYREEAKIAKDVSAGLVLIGAIGAVIVGCVIFLPYIFRFLLII